MASELSQHNKKQMRIALVGIAPADQVTLKGYLRVLLRLDVSLEWVSATESNVDLFMINNEFRTAGSVAKLLEVNRDVPVLYVARNDLGEGSISQHLLTLPLKQINLLNDWLVRYVPVLGSAMATHHVSSSTSTPTPAQDISSQRSISAAVAAMASTNGLAKLTAIAEMIDKLQSRSQGLFEVVDAGVGIAVIDPVQQLVWSKTAHPRLGEHWQLRPYVGVAPSGYAKDSSAWLWQVAWDNSELLSALLDDKAMYQIRHWIRPNKADRHDLLQIMTAMEQAPISIAQIAQRAKVSVAVVRRAVVALLFSGNLTQPSYQSLRAKLVAGTVSIPEPVVIAPKPVIEPEVEIKPELPSPEQEEKLGFFARLRRKLGL